MKYEFYGRQKVEKIRNISMDTLKMIEEMGSHYEHHDDLLNMLNHKRNNVYIDELIETYHVNDGFKLVKTLDNIDESILNKVDKLEINGAKCTIIDTVYDVSNGVVKCYLDKTFFYKRFEKDDSNQLINTIREKYTETLDEMIEKIEEEIRVKKSRESRRGFLKNLFK